MSLDSIATNWIEDIIQPQYGQLGPNLAARKFSRTSQRFIDFHMTGWSEPTEPNKFDAPTSTYAKYIADIVRQTSYLGTWLKIVLKMRSKIFAEYEML